MGESFGRPLLRTRTGPSNFPSKPKDGWFRTQSATNIELCGRAGTPTGVTQAGSHTMIAKTKHVARIWGSLADSRSMESSISLNMINGSNHSVWRLRPADWLVAAKSGAYHLAAAGQFITVAPLIHTYFNNLFRSDDACVVL